MQSFQHVKKSHIKDVRGFSKSILKLWISNIIIWIYDVAITGTNTVSQNKLNFSVLGINQKEHEKKIIIEPYYIKITICHKISEEWKYQEYYI